MLARLRLFRESAQVPDLPFIIPIRDADAHERPRAHPEDTDR